MVSLMLQSLPLLHKAIRFASEATIRHDSRIRCVYHREVQ
jgi:hypothetical protein